MRALSNKELAKILKMYNCKINDICCKDNITNLNDGWTIVNMDNGGGGGTHWVCFYKGKHNIYFDSFGIVAPVEIENIIKPYTMSKIDIQNINSGSCGWFCMFLIFYMSKQDNSILNYNHFLKLFSNNTGNNEIQLYNFFIGV